MAVLVWMVEPPRIGCEVLVAIDPAGPFSTTFTVTGSPTAGLSSTWTVQVRTTVDPMGRTGLGVLLDKITEVGAGTACIKMIITISFNYTIP